LVAHLLQVAAQTYLSLHRHAIIAYHVTICLVSGGW